MADEEATNAERAVKVLLEIAEREAAFTAGERTAAATAVLSAAERGLA